MKVGTIVVLKSGSPDMTVDYIDTDEGKVRCVWFIGQEPKSYAFSIQSLNVKEEKQ